MKTKRQDINTLENLIEGLDQRGLLVFQVLLGQQAMKVLSEKYQSTPPSKDFGVTKVIKDLS